YYSDALAGRSTASGEPYDPGELTAATRDLPFDTRVRVTRVDTGESVVVRVNDRGPFGDRRRIIDLSRAAAERLHMIREGVIEVRVEILAED
ncbi:MAG: septal ring lytic transglycosylase RlpA family protein, partial [Sandaracinaceae bacterium]